jgi:oligoendopeptidase F
VGRGEVPGIVFANYYRDQARSLSHYEGFRPYHDAFYRFVEPASVTPHTYQARLRALHAALVIAVRHAGNSALLGNDTAREFDPATPLVAAVIESLTRRCRRSASEDQQKEIAGHLQRLAKAWKNEATRCRENRRALDYQVPDNDAGRDRLLCAHDAKIPGLWATLNSMRHVENTALLEVS